MDLNNEYFKISYPKCFHVEATGGDDDEGTSKDSASIDLHRTKKCKNYSYDDYFNLIQVNYEFLTHYSGPEEIDSIEPSATTAYRQPIDVHGIPGIVNLNLGLSAEVEKKFEPKIGFDAFLFCKGKKNEVFHFQMVTSKGEEAIKYLEKKKFDLPEDFKQILSSFECQKNR